MLFDWVYLQKSMRNNTWLLLQWAIINRKVFWCHLSPEFFPPSCLGTSSEGTPGRVWLSPRRGVTGCQADTVELFCESILSDWCSADGWGVKQWSLNFQDENFCLVRCSPVCGYGNLTARVKWFAQIYTLFLFWYQESYSFYLSASFKSLALRPVTCLLVQVVNL